MPYVGAIPGTRNFIIDISRRVKIEDLTLSSNKLDSLRDAAGGLFGKGLLVSYRKLTADQKKRLRANRLDYCDGPNLKNLNQKIREWLK